MRVLVLGGTFFIGPYVVTRLEEMGHEVTVFHRGKTSADLPPGVEHLLGDRRNLENFKGEFRRLSPDVVLDMFPFTEQDARTVMSAFKGIARRVVAISSQDVYHAFGLVQGIESGPPDPVPLTEDAPLRKTLYPYRALFQGGDRPHPNHSDDYEKILVERAVMGDPDLPGTILRLPMVYGPRDGKNRLFEMGFLKRMNDQRPAILLDEGFARWRWTRGYVENVAAAIALAVADERATGRIYNVGEPETLPMAEWARKVGKAAGWTGEVIVLPKDRLPAHMVMDSGANQDILVDSTRIRKELGYRETVPMDEALRRTIAWERANPPEKIDPRMYDYDAEDAVLAELTKQGTWS